MNFDIHLKYGGRDEVGVKALQRQLNDLGAHLVVDGIFGNDTLIAVKDFQSKNKLTVDGVVGFQTWSALMGGEVATRPETDDAALAALKIKQTFLPKHCYNQSVVPKKQIVLHHTAGGPLAQGVYEGWKSKANKVATAFVIERGGQIYQMFDENHWAWHLGVEPNDRVKHFAQGLDAQSIAIELCNWGWLNKQKPRSVNERPVYRNYVFGEVPKEEVCDLGQVWRGLEYFEKYSAAQIIATCKLVKYLAEKHKIPLTGFCTPSDGWFDINQNALDGKTGLWNHTNYRTDKTDLSPQPEIIDALCGLKNIYA